MPGQFQPQTGRDLFGDNVNLMSRIDSNRRANQQADEEAQQFEILKPVIAAKAHADIVSAGASIATNTQQEQFRAQAALDAPAFQKEFFDAIKIPDFNEQWKALRIIQAKVAYFKGVKGYEGFYDTVNNAAVNSVGANIADMKLQAASEQAKDANRTRLEAVGMAGEYRNQLGQLKIDSEKQINEAKIAATKDRDTQKAQTQMMLVKMHQSLTDPVQIQTKVKELRDQAAEDPENAEVLNKAAKQLEDRAVRMTQPKQASNKDALIQAILGEKPSGDSASQKTAPPVPKGTNMFKDGGKEYPISVDGKGVRAYFKDGKWIKIPAGQ